MPGRTLAVLGSGPGIGVSVACAFSVRGFTHIALVSRNADRLPQDQDRVLDAIQERGYSCQVKTWTCDLSNFGQLSKTLAEVEKFGSLECVFFNAARVAGLPALEESIEQIEQDFRVRNFCIFRIIKILRTLTVVDEYCIVQNSRVGLTTTKAGRSRQLAVVHRYKYNIALQAARAQSCLAFNG